MTLLPTCIQLLKCPIFPTHIHQKKELATPPIDYVYPQRLPLKETQANLDLAMNLSHIIQTKDLKPPCVATPIIPTPTIPPLSLQGPIMQTLDKDLNIDLDTPSSSELVSCQENYLNDE